MILLHVLFTVYIAVIMCHVGLRMVVQSLNRIPLCNPRDYSMQVNNFLRQARNKAEQKEISEMQNQKSLEDSQLLFLRQTAQHPPQQREHPPQQSQLSVALSWAMTPIPNNDANSVTRHSSRQSQQNSKSMAFYSQKCLDCMRNCMSTCVHYHQKSCSMHSLIQLISTKHLLSARSHVGLQYDSGFQHRHTLEISQLSSRPPQ